MLTTIPDEYLVRMAVKFRMLSDPTRLAILRALMAGEKSVGAVVDETRHGQANVSKHLKMLSDAGMLSRRKEGLHVLYAISDPIIEKLCTLVCFTIREEAEAEVAKTRNILKQWNGHESST